MRSFQWLILLLITSLLMPQLMLAATPAELKQSIDNKTKELQEIDRQIQESQKALDEAETQKSTLSQEIKKIDYQLNQLNLGIRSSQLTIEKLGLEIEALATEITGKEVEIGDKKTAIAQLLRQLYEKDQEGTLVVLFKNNSLAESMAEIQTITNLSDYLDEVLVALQVAKQDAETKKQQTAEKKAAVEIENINLQNRRAIANDQKQERQALLTQTKNQEKLYQEQLKKLEKQRADISAEIDEIEKDLRLLVDPSLLPSARAGVLVWPSSALIMTQGYGRTSYALRAYPSKWHNGIDIGGPIGAAIYSAEDGTVMAVGNQDQYCRGGAYGRYIVVKHDNNLTSLYAHLSRQIVSVGQRVTRGQTIGYMGNSGWATGSHLHFTVWSTATYRTQSSRSCGPMPVGGDVNPLSYVAKPSVINSKHEIRSTKQYLNPKF